VSYHPGETNLRSADVVIINKTDTANADSIATVRRNIEAANPGAVVIEAASPLFVEGREQIRGKRVLVIEDGPTVTHGGMGYGAGAVAARKFGAAEIVDPHPYAVASIADTYRKYPTTGPVLPAMGYGPKQIADLEATIRAADCDLVIIATPIDLRRLIGIDKPSVRVRYELQEIGKPDLDDVLRVKFA
jgi:predicted GTPase